MSECHKYSDIFIYIITFTKKLSICHNVNITFHKVIYFLKHTPFIDLIKGFKVFITCI